MENKGNKRRSHRTWRAVGAGLAVSALVVVGGVQAANAKSYSGSHSCSSSQRVWLDTRIGTLSGGGTTSTKTLHEHSYGGYSSVAFYGIGIKTSYSGLSSYSSWTATTSIPTTAELIHIEDGCAAKPV